MPKTFQLVLRSAAGAQVALYTFEAQGGVSFDYRRRVNSPGAHAIRFMQKANETLAAFEARTWGLFELDGQLEFRWRWPERGIPWHTDGAFFHRTPTWWYTAAEEGSALFFQSGGRGYLDILNRPIIFATPESPEAVKTGPAESVIKEYVSEQAGPGAGTRARAGLSIEADGGGGNVVRVNKPYRNLLATIQEIAKVGGGDFDLVRTGAGLFEFRWFDGQRGTDRSGTVTFNIALGNMEQPRLTQRRHNEINAVYVGGQGQGAARVIVLRTDPARIADSPWNRIERWRDGRHEADIAGLNDLGDEWVEEGRPFDDLTFIPLQTPGSTLDLHYFFGDLVTGEMLGISAVKQIKAYTYVWSEDEQIVNIETEDE